MNFKELLGRLIDLENLRSVEEIRPSFAAPWASGSPAWVFFGCLGLALLAVFFYMKFQARGRLIRIVLAASRALLLSLLLLLLAEPILTVKLTSSPKPLFWILLDGTDSMGMVDQASGEERNRLVRAVGRSQEASREPEKLSRAGSVQALFRKKDRNLLKRLEEKFRLDTFIFERPDGARHIQSSSSSGALDPDLLAEELTTKGKVTALGAALLDLASRHATGNLAGLLLVSDFNQNAGPSALSAARKLGVPVHTLGVGPRAAVDLAVGLRAPLVLKKAERSTITAMIRQSGLEGRLVTVKLSARPLAGGESNSGGTPSIQIAEKQVEMKGATQSVDIPFTPEETGRYLLAAEVERMEGEVVDQNNRAERDTNIIDDFLRLMYVEYEPTWEWRFIKEVFHRDKLVGLRGFRTFLRSSDPRVRQANPLFLSTMTPARSEFFANDVMFLGDTPASALNNRFCEMVREFVSRFGGGLVVLAGPRFGPGQLASTPIGDMLPVVADPDGRLRSDREFRLRLSPEASQIDFMQLGSNEEENKRAWSNLGSLPWYQPVLRLHPLATCLAEHPQDTCADGKSPQPLIAIRRFGRGEVVYLGFNETWRLRRKHGELYYRQFWGQMIHRLGLSHALGNQKRFVVRTDRKEYQADETVLLTVEAYDGNFQPLGEDSIPGRTLEGELVLPSRTPGAEDSVRPLSISQRLEGIFETRFQVFTGGEHRVRAKDPVQGKQVEISFQVASLSAERRSAVRNVALEEEIAQATGGRSYNLESVDAFPEEVQVPRKIETTIRVFPLWNTWLCFGVVLALMLGEWLLRKLVNLS